MPRGIYNRNKKINLQEKEEVKEEILIEQNKKLHELNEELIQQSSNQEQLLRERIDNLFLVLRRVEADKEGLQVAIASLGKRINELQDMNIAKHTNYNNLQAQSVYSNAEKRM